MGTLKMPFVVRRVVQELLEGNKIGESFLCTMLYIVAPIPDPLRPLSP